MSRDSKGSGASVSCFSWFGGKHGDTRRREIPARAAAQERMMMMQELKRERESPASSDSMSVVATLGYHPPPGKDFLQSEPSTPQKQKLGQGSKGPGTPTSSKPIPSAQQPRSPASQGLSLVTRGSGSLTPVPIPPATSGAAARLPVSPSGAGYKMLTSPAHSKKPAFAAVSSPKKSVAAAEDSNTDLELEYVQDIPIELSDEVPDAPKAEASRTATEDSGANISSAQQSSSNNQSLSTAQPSSSSNQSLSTAQPSSSNNQSLSTAQPSSSNNQSLSTAQQSSSNNQSLSTAQPSSSSNQSLSTAPPSSSNNQRSHAPAEIKGLSTAPKPAGTEPGIRAAHGKLALQDGMQDSAAARDIGADLRATGNGDLVNWIAPILAEDPTVVLTVPSSQLGRDSEAEQVRLVFNDRAFRPQEPQATAGVDIASPISRTSPSSGAASGGSSTGHSKDTSSSKAKEQRAFEQAISAAATPHMSGQSVQSRQSGRSQPSNSDSSPITSAHEPVPQLQQEDYSDSEEEDADFEIEPDSEGTETKLTLLTSPSRTSSTERPVGSLIVRIEQDLQKLGDSDDNASDDELINVNDSRYFRDSTGRRGLLC